MTQLYIDGHLCDLPTDFKITLVTENLYFSKASTYTYDIQLPIAPFSNNAKIFGNINRTDKRITTTTLPAQLIVDNKVIVNGVAVIVGTSDTSVSVQLMQGNSELNWKQRLEKIYIDELNLGTLGPFGFTKEDDGRVGIADSLKTGHGTGASYYRWKWDCIKEYTNGQIVTTPIFNSESGKLMNALSNDGNNFVFLHDNIDYPLGLEPNYTARPNRIAAQPLLKLVITKVFMALGYTIRTNELVGKNIYENLYVANSTEVWHFADMLPHLTATEFIEQLQLLFNCVIEINDKDVFIYDRKKFYAATNLTASHAQLLPNVVDEYTVDVDTETTVTEGSKSKIYDISYENFGTKFLGHNFDNVKHVDASGLTTTANPNVFATNYRGHKVSSPYLDNGQIKGNEVDRYQPSPASEGTDETTLKFIPIEEFTEYYWAGRWNGLSNLTPRDLLLCPPTSIGRLIDDDTTTIQDLLDETAVPEERTTTDRLCLGFLRTCHEHLQADVSDPSSDVEYVSEILQSSQEELFRAYIDITHYTYVKSLTLDAEPYCLSMFPLRNLDNSADVDNLYKEFYADGTETRTSIVYTLRFCTSKIFDALQPFIIKNQNFACKQIKYSITARGFEKIAEGEFYKL